MLMVNWMPVDVELPPSVPKPSSYSRRPRLREVDCGKPMPPGCAASGGGNMMYDQRVFRGSNYVRPTAAGPTQPQPSAVMQRKFHEARRRLKRKMLAAGDGSRAHALVQCDPMPARIAELDTRTRTTQACAQTDVTPGHMRQLRGIDTSAGIVRCKTGLDVGTQVAYRDLSDFDADAYPVAEVMVATALEQAAVCVLYEDDAAVLRREQAVYESLRHADRTELERLDRLEAFHRRRRLRALAKAERAAPGPTYRAIHGLAFTKQYMASLRADALGHLESAGYLKGEKQVAAWLRNQLRGKLQQQANGAGHLNALIGDVIVNRPRAVKRTVNAACNTSF